MYKLGRGGGGRGGGKRSLPPPAPSRPVTAPGPGRLSIGGGGGRGRPGSAPGAGGTLPGKEESFSLSSSPYLDFGAIIRLTPDLIEEIRRIESHGGSAKIKFAHNSNLPNGNVIDVAGKEFEFTWSKDELCDIYEESRSGEGGDGLLLECGSAWRKLNVVRTLDESTKKQVKKRSEEAERKQKSRKAIILDASNPAMRNQVKKMAAAGVEGNMRRMGWKQKKESFYQRQKVEPSQVSNSYQPKGAQRMGTSSNKGAKGMLSMSPISHPPEQPSVSPFTTSISCRGDANHEEIIPPVEINTEHIDVGIETEMPAKTSDNAKYKIDRQKGHGGDQPVDFQNNRSQRVSENPGLKGLKKTAGEMKPELSEKNRNTEENIEESGKYLNTGTDVKISAKKGPESESCPESAHDFSLAMESIFEEKVTDESFGHQGEQNPKVEDESFEMISMLQDDPEPSGNIYKKPSNQSEGKTSSSESGSETDSESDSSDSGSDSGSQSRSRSKSRSPVGSASGSSSDSETDGSSSSKEGSDMDVDIMTNEDEKEVAEPKAEASSIKLSSSPMVRASDGEQEQIDIMGDQDDQVPSLPIDLNDLARDNEMVKSIEGAKEISSTNTRTSEKIEVTPKANMGSNSGRVNSRFLPEPICSPDKFKHPDDLQEEIVKSPRNTSEHVTERTIGGKQSIVSGLSAHEKMVTTKKIKSKRAFSSENFKEKTENVKRSKGTGVAEGVPSRNNKHGASSTNSWYHSPEDTRQDQYKPKNNNVEWGSIKEFVTQDNNLKGRNEFAASESTWDIQQSPEFWSSSSLDAEQPGSRTGDVSRRKSRNRFNSKTERMHAYPDTMPNNKLYKDTQEEISLGEKLSPFPDYSNNPVGQGHLKDGGQTSRNRKADGRASPISGNGGVLRRELSVFVLGELRDPPSSSETAAGGFKKQSDGKHPFKSSENGAASTDSSNLDMSKGRNGSHLIESRKTSPRNLRGEIHGNREGFYKKMSPDEQVDPAQVLHKTISSQSQQHLRIDRADSAVKSHLDNSAELARRGETGTTQGVGPEKHVGSFTKYATNLAVQHDVKHGVQKSYNNVKELKQQKPNLLGDSMHRSNNGLLIGNETNGQKRGESFTEEDNSFYSKYDKEIPELRDSISNFSQYNDCVQEYREKYECYISLNKSLEKIRNDFLKVGEELEISKGRGSKDYFRVVDQLKDMFQRHGERNRQMKRVFIVLHEELKTLKQRIQEFAEMHTKE